MDFIIPSFYKTKLIKSTESKLDKIIKNQENIKIKPQTGSNNNLTNNIEIGKNINNNNMNTYRATKKVIINNNSETYSKIKYKTAKHSPNQTLKKIENNINYKKDMLNDILNKKIKKIIKNDLISSSNELIYNQNVDNRSNSYRWPKPKKLLHASNNKIEESGNASFNSKSLVKEFNNGYSNLIPSNNLKNYTTINRVNGTNNQNSISKSIEQNKFNNISDCGQIINFINNNDNNNANTININSNNDKGFTSNFNLMNFIDEKIKSNEKIKDIKNFCSILNNKINFIQNKILEKNNNNTINQNISNYFDNEKMNTINHKNSNSFISNNLNNSNSKLNSNLKKSGIANKISNMQNSYTANKLAKNNYTKFLLKYSGTKDLYKENNNDISNINNNKSESSPNLLNIQPSDTPKFGKTGIIYKNKNEKCIDDKNKIQLNLNNNENNLLSPIQGIDGYSQFLKTSNKIQSLKENIINEFIHQECNNNIFHHNKGLSEISKSKGFLSTNNISGFLKSTQMSTTKGTINQSNCLNFNQSNFQSSVITNNNSSNIFNNKIVNNNINYNLNNEVINEHINENDNKGNAEQIKIERNQLKKRNFNEIKNNIQKVSPNTTRAISAGKLKKKISEIKKKNDSNENYILNETMKTDRILHKKLDKIKNINYKHFSISPAFCDHSTSNFKRKDLILPNGNKSNEGEIIRKKNIKNNRMNSLCQSPIEAVKIGKSNSLHKYTPNIDKIFYSTKNNGSIQNLSNNNIYNYNICPLTNNINNKLPNISECENGNKNATGYVNSGIINNMIDKINLKENNSQKGNDNIKNIKDKNDKISNKSNENIEIPLKKKQIKTILNYYKNSSLNISFKKKLHNNDLSLITPHESALICPSSNINDLDKSIIKKTNKNSLFNDMLTPFKNNDESNKNIILTTKGSRDSTFYNNEKEKICTLIKNYYLENKCYPKESSQDFYLYGRQIGHGAFGKVNLALHIASGRLVALKSFAKKNLKNKSAREKIKHEISILSKLRSPFINQILDRFESEKHIFIVMEYICGDLLGFIRKRGKLSESISKVIFKQIIEGLSYIHKNHIVHRDIKLDNILIDLSNTIKICDFGVSRRLNNGDIMQEHCGTPAYIAPEIFENKGYKGYACDIWSAGVTLYYMLGGIQPFRGDSIKKLERKVMIGKYKKLDCASPEANDLIDKMLQINPDKRITIEGIIAHPWLKNVNVNNRKNINLFTDSEKILLSKYNVNYLYSDKEELIENFTVKNLETTLGINKSMQERNSKSIIYAPYNSYAESKNNLSSSEYYYEEEKINKGIKIMNNICKFGHKVQQANIKYELSNNQDFDNGVIKTEKEEEFNNKNEILEKNDNLIKNSLEDNKIINFNSPNNNSLNNSFEIENKVEFNKELIKQIENSVGFDYDYILNSLKKNKICYATATYYLLEKENEEDYV